MNVSMGPHSHSHPNVTHLWYLLANVACITQTANRTLLYHNDNKRVLLNIRRHMSIENTVLTSLHAAQMPGVVRNLTRGPVSVSEDGSNVQLLQRISWQPHVSGEVMLYRIRYGMGVHNPEDASFSITTLNTSTVLTLYISTWRASGRGSLQHLGSCPDQISWTRKCHSAKTSIQQWVMTYNSAGSTHTYSINKYLLSFLLYQMVLYNMLNDRCKYPLLLLAVLLLTLALLTALLLPLCSQHQEHPRHYRLRQCCVVVFKWIGHHQTAVSEEGCHSSVTECITMEQTFTTSPEWKMS